MNVADTGSPYATIFYCTKFLPFTFCVFYRLYAGCISTLNKDQKIDQPFYSNSLKLDYLEMLMNSAVAVSLNVTHKHSGIVLRVKVGKIGLP